MGFFASKMCHSHMQGVMLTRRTTIFTRKRIILPKSFLHAYIALLQKREIFTKQCFLQDTNSLTKLRYRMYAKKHEYNMIFCFEVVWFSSFKVTPVKLWSKKTLFRQGKEKGKKKEKTLTQSWHAVKIHPIPLRFHLAQSPTSLLSV